MKKNTDLLEPDTYYHIYNRGINGEDLFKEHRNYAFFLQKLASFILPIAEVFAYCLMKNHFHLCIRTLPTETISKNCCSPKETISNKEVTRSPEWYMGNQFASFFKSYAQGINKAYNRHGQLFKEVFRRISVYHENYLMWLIFYIHANPRLHGFTPDFSVYPHSSYKGLLSSGPTQLSRDKLMALFGSKTAFETFHTNQFPDEVMLKIGLE